MVNQKLHSIIATSDTLSEKAKAHQAGCW